MHFDEAQKTLHDLHADLCAALRRAEMAWYAMASDYQSKYAFSADYDSAFKRRYYDKATTCQHVVVQMEALALPKGPAEMAAFAATLKDAVEYCPWPASIREQANHLLEQIEAVSSTGLSQENSYANHRSR